MANGTEWGRRQSIQKTPPFSRREFYSNAVAGLFGLRPTFDVDLTLGTIADARGNGVPIFVRTTVGTVIDHENIVRYAKAGEVRFQGLRRVENLIAAESTWAAALNFAGTGTLPTLTLNAATAPNGTQTAHRIQLALNGGNNNAANQSRVDIGAWIVTGAGLARQSCWLRTNDGSVKTIALQTVSYNPNVHAVQVTGTWQRLTIFDGATYLITSANVLTIGLRGDAAQKCSDNADILFWHPQLENVAGQTNQNPAEFVSLGEKPAPTYHGAGVDAVRYFPWLNGNTVTGNVVNENASGAMISAATRIGYLPEGARTNLAWPWDDYGNANWTKTNSAVAATAVTKPDGAQGTTNKIGASDNVTNGLHAITVGGIAINTPYAVTVWVKGAEETVLVLANDNTGTATFNTGTGVATQDLGTAVMTSFPGGWWRCIWVFTASGTAAAGMRLNLRQNGAYIAAVTGDGMFFSEIQIEQVTATGLFASTGIPTTVGTVIRNASTLSYTNILAKDSIGTCYAEFTLYGFDSGSPNRILGPVATAAAPLTINNILSLAMWDETATLASNVVGSMVNNGVHKTAASWNASKPRRIIGLDGGIGATGGYDGTNIGGEPSTGIQVGGPSNGPHWGTVGKIRIYPLEITDAQIQALCA